jgi:hypothetical protein
MATVTISGLTGVTIGNLTGAASIVVDDSTLATRKATLAQVRTQMFAGGTGFTASDPLTCGSITATGNSTITGSLSGITSLAGTGAVSGFTSATFSSFIILGAASDLAFGGTRSIIRSPSDGNMEMRNASGGAFSNLQIAALTASGSITLDTNNTYLGARNAAGAAVREMLKWDSSNNVYLNAGQALIFRVAYESALAEAFRLASDKKATFSGVVALSEGSAGAPALYLGTDSANGIYRTGAAQIGTSAHFQVPDGAPATPGLGFTDAGGLGLYRISSTAFGLAANSALVLTIGSAAATFNSVPVSGITSLDTTGNISITKASGNTGLLKLGQTGVVNWYIQNTATSGDLRFDTDAGVKFTLTTAGGLTTTGNITLTAATSYLQLGGTSASFPAIRNTGNTLEVVLANGSDFAPFRAAAFTGTSWTGTGLIQTTLTTEQMRLRYDASNYVKTTVASTGVVTYATAASGDSHVFNVGSDAALTIAHTGALGGGTITCSGAIENVSSLSLADVAGSGVAPTIRFASGTDSTTNGHLWWDGSNLKFRQSGVTRTINWT